MVKKVVKAWNIDEDLAEWIKKSAHNSQINASQFVNAVFRAAKNRRKK